MHETKLFLQIKELIVNHMSFDFQTGDFPRSWTK